MVICMDMESGARTYTDPEDDVGLAYGEEVLNANPLPPELALGLQEIPASTPERHFVPTDVDAFLSAVYLYQE
ncbi:hypothetical protein HHL15_10955 [Zoogloea sp. G-4-1-14]|jgi:hypothetical protein|uniref:Uncharacterized protein n=2 Tax=Zoogloea dura TaxID=2728840 RepID=A0A848G4Z8_9RHOO|nr:hypothetical protein [Zoogloea dura]